jgi:hypothetical protein
MNIDQADEIPDDIKQHLVEIRAWLDENVTVYDDVQTVTLHNFEIDWEKLNGSFRIIVNEKDCEMPFRFACLTATGKPEVYRPMFHSPLGAPASYAAVDISERIIDRMISTIAKFMPSIKPLGLDKESGKILTFQTPQHERLPSVAEIQAAKDIVSQPDFLIKMDFS